MKKRTKLEWLLTAGIALIVAASIFTLYQTFDGVLYGRPIEPTEIIIQTTATEYRVGDIVEAEISFCKNRDIKGTVQWQLIDTYLKWYPPRTTALPVGCYNKHIMPIEKIPADTLPAVYRFEGLVEYRINAINTVAVTIRSNDFRIVK